MQLSGQTLIMVSVHIYLPLFMQMDNLDPEVRALFDVVGITDKELQDKDTATFIYDFIEQHGGVGKLKQNPAPPPPPMAPPTPNYPSMPPPSVGE